MLQPSILFQDPQQHYKMHNAYKEHMISQKGKSPFNQETYQEELDSFNI